MSIVRVLFIAVGFAFLAFGVGIEGTAQERLKGMKTHATNFTKRYVLFQASVGFVMIILGFYFTFFLHDTASWRLHDITSTGSAIGREVSQELDGYTTFGIGYSGSIISANHGDTLVFAPMMKAVGGRGYRTVDTYGVTHTSRSSSAGPGSFAINDRISEDTDTITSGNYGTKASSNDLGWCFVIHDLGLYVKFTNDSNGYPHSATPITCKNGK